MLVLQFGRQAVAFLFETILSIETRLLLIHCQFNLVISLPQIDLKDSNVFQFLLKLVQLRLEVLLILCQCLCLALVVLVLLLDFLFFLEEFLLHHLLFIDLDDILGACLVDLFFIYILLEVEHLP